uniref:Uncharacterized protein n=1 Tax=Glossina palpalis gambiensis TaxID=67801 RepID=A0A1B0BZ91_9MUSC
MEKKRKIDFVAFANNCFYCYKLNIFDGSLVGVTNSKGCLFCEEQLGINGPETGVRPVPPSIRESKLNMPVDGVCIATPLMSVGELPVNIEPKLTGAVVTIGVLSEADAAANEADSVATFGSGGVTSSVSSLVWSTRRLRQRAAANLLRSRRIRRFSSSSGVILVAFVGRRPPPLRVGGGAFEFAAFAVIAVVALFEVLLVFGILAAAATAAMAAMFAVAKSLLVATELELFKSSVKSVTEFCEQKW